MEYQNFESVILTIRKHESCLSPHMSPNMSSRLKMSPKSSLNTNQKPDYSYEYIYTSIDKASGVTVERPATPKEICQFKKDENKYCVGGECQIDGKCKCPDGHQLYETVCHKAALTSSSASVRRIKLLCRSDFGL